MEIRFSILLISIPILFFGCNQKEEPRSYVPDKKISFHDIKETAPDLVVYEAATSIFGEWFNINPENSSIIILNQDGSFQYINRSTLNQLVKGRWSVEGGDYILRSNFTRNKSDSIQSKENQSLFKKRFSFKNGFLYETGRDESDYFVQSKNYR